MRPSTDECDGARSPWAWTRVFASTLIPGIVGGAIFSLLRLPLPWMLGPLTAVMLVSQGFRRPTYWPFSLRQGAQVILGSVMGGSFSPDTALSIVGQLPSMLTATLATIAFGFGLSIVCLRLTGISRASSILGFVPGGLSQMTVLSDEIEGCDVSIVTFIQTIRLLVVVFLVPFMAQGGMAVQTMQGSLSSAFAFLQFETAFSPALGGMLFLATVAALIARKLRFPTPFLLGPAIAISADSIAGYDLPGIPRVLVVVAQICFGGYLGHSIRIASLGSWRRLLPLSIIGSVALVAFTTLVGLGLSSLYPFSFLTGFLSTSPGGMSEMVITAVAVDANISVVTSYQMFRWLFIMTAVPVILKKWLRQSEIKETSIDETID